MESQSPAPMPLTCEECGHRASLHQPDACRAVLLGKGTPVRTCGCRKTLREILTPRDHRPPAELRERQRA